MRPRGATRLRSARRDRRSGLPCGTRRTWGGAPGGGTALGEGEEGSMMVALFGRFFLAGFAYSTQRLRDDRRVCEPWPRAAHDRVRRRPVEPAPGGEGV